MGATLNRFDLRRFSLGKEGVCVRGIFFIFENTGSLPQVPGLRKHSGSYVVPSGIQGTSFGKLSAVSAICSLMRNTTNSSKLSDTRAINRNTL